MGTRGKNQGSLRLRVSETIYILSQSSYSGRQIDVVPKSTVDVLKYQKSVNKLTLYCATKEGGKYTELSVTKYLKILTLFHHLLANLSPHDKRMTVFFYNILK